MRHFMAQFGPALKLPWTTTDGRARTRGRRAPRQAGGTIRRAGRRALAIGELEQLRDDCLVAVLSGLRGEGFGAGETIAETERRWLSRAAGRVADAADGVLRLHEAIVAPEWIDYNGHMTEYRYLQLLADTTDAFLARIGADGDYVAAGHSYFTVESHLRHTREAHAGDRLYVTTRLLGHDAKRLHLFHELHRSDDETLVATGEHMLVHVDAAAGRSAPAGADVLSELGRIAERQHDLPVPEAAGRRIEGAAACERAAPGSHRVRGSARRHRQATAPSTTTPRSPDRRPATASASAARRRTTRPSRSGPSRTAPRRPPRPPSGRGPAQVETHVAAGVQQRQQRRDRDRVAQRRVARAPATGRAPGWRRGRAGTRSRTRAPRRSDRSQPTRWR